MNHQSGDIEIIKQIDAYLKGQLSEEKTEELWVELIKNKEYLEYLETELTVKSIFEEKKNLNEDSVSKVTELHKSWKWLAAAAAVAILVVAINLLKMDGSVPLREQTIGNINMTNNLAAPLVMRSQKADLSGADSLMNIGFEAALSGNIPRAVKMYNEVTQRFKGKSIAAQAHLNIGIIRYNSGDYQPASKAFEQALSVVDNNDLLKEKAYWYLGNAYINLEQIQKARNAIQNAYDLDGTYRKPAFRLLQKIDYKLGNTSSEDLESR